MEFFRNAFGFFRKPTQHQGIATRGILGTVKCNFLESVGIFLNFSEIIGYGTFWKFFNFFQNFKNF